MMMSIDRNDLKERIAISDAFNADERNFLLMAVNSMPELEFEQHAPRNYIGRIEALWAYLSVDEGGEELVSAPMREGLLSVPLIAADKARLVGLKSFAISVVRALGKPVRLVKFWDRQDIEIIRPGGGARPGAGALVASGLGERGDSLHGAPRSRRGHDHLLPRGRQRAAAAAIPDAAGDRRGHDHHRAEDNLRTRPAVGGGTRTTCR